jgi:hypothetical protein
MTPAIDHSSVLVDENEKNEHMENLEPLAAKPSSPRPKKKTRTEKGMFHYTTSKSSIFFLYIYIYIYIYNYWFYLLFGNCNLFLVSLISSDLLKLRFPSLAHFRY